MPSYRLAQPLEHSSSGSMKFVFEPPMTSSAASTGRCRLTEQRRQHAPGNGWISGGCLRWGTCTVARQASPLSAILRGALTEGENPGFQQILPWQLPLFSVQPLTPACWLLLWRRGWLHAGVSQMFLHLSTSRRAHPSLGYLPQGSGY